ncbi:Radical SAM domain protein [Desulfurispirillum indicum S5]|uniref:Aminodeoxyfutalosine synthase n=1 Tax=Desulfurispirillum indicum (strain ATCC BAA-1389 / DSM 22839 / S5) TaxID=653733 RepID=E6W556_DESIS|nr:aminofutalosine synthase MqnE [Desulfurispirillum indicum]ADU67135.1 Radical SAM domain protein [Desulfurispirillum indicum S5]
METDIIFSGMEKIAHKVLAGERLGMAEAVELYDSHNLLGLGRMADILNQRKSGGRVYFNQNRHINHTNVCVNRCRFCAFGKDASEHDAYTMSLEKVLEAAAKAPSTVTEFHIVGGLHPDLPFSYYTQMLSALKKSYPHVHLKAFTAVEIDYFASLTGLRVEEVLEELIDAGLGSMPGGGAEIFAEEVRQRICPEKISGQRWLDIHETAHRLGIHTNATLLYGHVESSADRIDHLERLRRLQDRTGMFQAFIPLAFHSENTDIVKQGTTGVDDLKTLAMARIYLDNFDHIKAYWIMLGEGIAQISLSFGVNDLDGTVVEEKITHAAGAKTSEAMEKDHLIHLIRSAGKIPTERTTLYEILEAQP